MAHSAPCVGALEAEARIRNYGERVIACVVAGELQAEVPCCSSWCAADGLHSGRGRLLKKDGLDVLEVVLLENDPQLVGQEAGEPEDPRIRRADIWGGL